MSVFDATKPGRLARTLSKARSEPVMLLDVHPAFASDLRPDESNFWDRSGS